MIFTNSQILALFFLENCFVHPLKIALPYPQKSKVEFLLPILLFLKLILRILACSSVIPQLLKLLNFFVLISKNECLKKLCLHGKREEVFMSSKNVAITLFKRYNSTKTLFHWVFQRFTVLDEAGRSNSHDISSSHANMQQFASYCIMIVSIKLWNIPCSHVPL